MQSFWVHCLFTGQFSTKDTGTFTDDKEFQASNFAWIATHVVQLFTLFCLIRFVGTRKSPATGISLGVVVVDFLADSVVGNWVVVEELWRFSFFQCEPNEFVSSTSFEFHV